MNLKGTFFFSKRIWCVQLSGSTDICRWSGPFNQIARNKSDWYTVIILLQKMCFNDFGRISWAWCTIRGYHKCWKNFNTVPRRGEDGTVQKWWRMNTVFFFLTFNFQGGPFNFQGGPYPTGSSDKPKRLRSSRHLLHLGTVTPPGNGSNGSREPVRVGVSPR